MKLVLMTMFLVLLWDPVTLNCDGSPANDVAYYEVEAAMCQAKQLFFVGTTTDTQFDLGVTVQPGEAWCLRVHAWDFAGNSSRECGA